jgi:hypothetical protein
VTFLGGGLLPTTYVLAIASFLLLAASGLAMHAWLRRFASPLAALIGAGVFVAAPYHVLIDHYYRGAFGEFAAIMFLPLIAGALMDVRSGARGGVLKLALSCAGLIYCHMPTALLVSLIMIPAYVAFLALNGGTWGERAAFLARAAFAGACATLLAAPYLAPALSLQGHIMPQAWSIDAESYAPLRPDLWPQGRVLFFTGLGSITAGWLLLAAGVAWQRRGAPDAAQTMFWTVFAAACAGLVLGAVPGFWSLPVIERVQFPMRLMPVVEFAAVTAFVLALAERADVRLWRAAGIALVVSMWGVAVMGGFAARNVWRTFTSLPAWVEVQNERMFDAPEYLPAGFFRPGVDWYERPLTAARAAPNIATPGTAARVQGAPLGRGAIRVEADPDISARVVLRRFYFPSWAAVRQSDGAAVATVAYGPSRFVSFEASPGESYVVGRAILPIERIAWLACAIGAAALMVWTSAAALWRRKLGRRDQVAQHPVGA